MRWLNVRSGKPFTRGSLHRSASRRLARDHTEVLIVLLRSASSPVLELFVLRTIDLRLAERHAVLVDMDILKMLADLREEREQLGEAIIALERLASGLGKRRGRPPAWMSAQKNAPKRRGRPPGSKNKTDLTNDG
jgi:hypothetical protein